MPRPVPAGTAIRITAMTKYPHLPATIRLLLTGVLVASPVYAQQVPAGGLSLDQAIRIAQENNPGFLAQENNLRAADWAGRVANANLFLPSINSSTSFGYSQGGQVRVDDVVVAEQPSRLSSTYSLSLGFNLSGAELLEPSRARAQRAATGENVRRALATLESEVTQRYLQVLEGRDAVVQAEREVGRTEAQLELARGRFDVGAGTQLDVRRAEVESGRARIRLLQAQNTASNQTLLLGQTMGMQLPVDVALTEMFTLFEPPWTEEELLEIARTNSPVLAASRAQIRVAGLGVRSALTSYIPSVSLGTSLSGTATELLEGGNSSLPFDYQRNPFGVSLNFSLPIFNGLTRERQVEQARIERSNAQYQLRTEELALEADVRTSLRNLQTAYVLSLLEEENRSIAEDEVELATERIRFGVAPNLELIEAQSRLGEAERSQIASVYTFHQTLAALEALIGARLER